MTRRFRSVTAFAGGGRSSNNTGFMFIALKPLNERAYQPYGDDWFDRLRQKLHIHPAHVSADQVVNRLRAKLTSVPGARSSFRPIRTSRSAVAAARPSISTRSPTRTSMS